MYKHGISYILLYTMLYITNPDQAFFRKLKSGSKSEKSIRTRIRSAADPAPYPAPGAKFRRRAPLTRYTLRPGLYLAYIHRRKVKYWTQCPRPAIFWQRNQDIEPDLH